MDFRYYDYLMGNSKYYSPHVANNEKQYKVKLPADWSKIVSQHWINVSPNKIDDFPEQGWKIHISVVIREAQKCLTIVSEYLFNKNIAFKYVKNEFQLTIKNSKNAARESSGKFITIYPNDIKEFKKIIDKLEKLLVDLEKGAYILSDRRWKNSNIYYRYGGFKEKRLENGALAIVNEQGKLVEDLRLPYYNVPDWIEIPDFIKDNEIEEEQETELSKYKVNSALHFSNSGGIYEVEGEDLKKYILKEARSGAGLDGNLNDSVYRLKKEYSTMKKLDNIESVANVYKLFKAWEHYFLVMEYVEGESLASWIVRNYPLSKNSRTPEYIDKLYTIANSCCKALKTIHELGVTHGDIQPKNILIKEDSGVYSVKFIDFETSGEVGKKGNKSLGTPGYFDSLEDFNEQRDWTGLLRIFKNALIPVISLETLANNVFDIQCKWIKENFGIKAVHILNLILDYSKNAKYDIRYSKNKKLSLKENIDYENFYNKVKDSLYKEVISNRGSIHGDIKQFLYPYGSASFGYGSLGVVLLLNRLKEDVPKDILNEIKINLNVNTLDIGLFSGLSGIAGSFYELGEKKEAKNIYEFMLKNKSLILKTSNISLESGLSGLGLSLLDMFISEDDKRYLEFSLEIYEKIRSVFRENPENIITTSGLTSDGMLYGWSGVSLYAFALYNILKKEEYLLFAKETLEYEIEKLQKIEDMLLLRIKDNRLMPYFSIGSVGLVIPLLLMEKYLEEYKVDKLLKDIIGTLLAKPCVCAGLFEGYVGLLYIAKKIDKYFLKKGEKLFCEKKVLKNLNQYLQYDKEERIYFPGNYSLRLSFDIATGLAGLLSSIGENNSSKFLWLPTINQKELFKL
ncbi:class III lanthionine synthetase LanKC [Gemella cuniculi]|uniref:class III lanthionine synthetase LanKC n=1 Tax=Gemella cuniculi TaxID=150240 RepID=UPI00040FA80A|nr:class III lanthionine synthetase LanKC [Gemella cuniculi]